MMIFFRLFFVCLVVAGILLWHFAPDDTVIVGSGDNGTSSGDLGDVIFASNDLVEAPQINDNDEVLVAVEGDTSTAATSQVSFIDISDLPSKVELKVPFVTQAPEAQWEDVRFQDACEEASILMAYQWVGGDRELGKKDATAALEEIFTVGDELFGADVIDTSTADTQKLMQEFFGYEAHLSDDVTRESIIKHLAEGRIVITPTDGRKLKNKYFSGDGPERHMTVVVGYDQKKDEFIVNDPGTRRGKAYRYDMELYMGSIRDYETGNKEPITGEEKRMLVVSK